MMEPAVGPNSTGPDSQGFTGRVRKALRPLIPSRFRRDKPVVPVLIRRVIIEADSGAES